MENTRQNQKPTFARNVIAGRAKLDISAMELAEKAGIPYPTLRDIEAGISGGRPHTKEKIAAALGTTVDFLNTPGGHITNNRSETITAIVTSLDALNDNDLTDVLNLIRSRRGGN